MKNVKRLFAAMIAIAIIPMDIMAEDKIEGSLGVDFVSQYIWRGQHNASVSLQPTAGLSWKGISLSTWGSFALTPTDKYKTTEEEIDITVAYETHNFHVGITDYYLFNNGNPFFKYRNDDTAHTFEANIGYDFGFLSVNWFTNFTGADGTTSTGKRAYSSYMQMDAPFKFAKIDWTATLGVVPYATDFYAADESYKFHVNQVALRAQYDIQFPHFTLPVFSQVIANPCSRDFFFVAGFSIKAL